MKGTTISISEQTPEAFDREGYEAIEYRELGDMIQKDAILALCQRLQAAAIKCDTYHVFVSYAPHVGGLAVYVESADTDYQNPERVLDRLVDEMVFMDRDGALDKLTDLIDQLQRLGIDV